MWIERCAGGRIVVRRIYLHVRTLMHFFLTSLQPAVKKQRKGGTDSCFTVDVLDGTIAQSIR